jgi:hypothetical protein
VVELEVDRVVVQVEKRRLRPIQEFEERGAPLRLFLQRSRRLSHASVGGPGLFEHALAGLGSQKVGKSQLAKILRVCVRERERE